MLWGNVVFVIRTVYYLQRQIRFYCFYFNIVCISAGLQKKNTLLHPSTTDSRLSTYVRLKLRNLLHPQIHSGVQTSPVSICEHEQTLVYSDLQLTCKDRMQKKEKKELLFPLPALREAGEGV